MKKLISLILIVCMFLCLIPPAFAEYDMEDKTLSFNGDGKFKIYVVNDIQDEGKLDERTERFLRASIKQEKPDLIILNGDQLSELMKNPTYPNIKTTLDNLLNIFDESETPFMFNFGNHDNDKVLFAPLCMQADIYYAHEYCFAAKDGYDCGSYNKPVMSSDGSRIALNIYMMNTGSWDPEGGMPGVSPAQIRWYERTSDELKAQNNGEVVRSVLFQHIPVNEIYSVLKEVSPLTPGAVRSTLFANTYKAYVIDESKLVTPDQDYFYGTAVGSEHPLKQTGQYSSWLRKGDIIGAFVGHDHLNNFVSRTDDGIILGYGRACGFATEGDGAKRGGRVFEFDENDIENFTFRTVTYESLFPGEDIVDTDGGIGFAVYNLLQLIRGLFADTFLALLSAKMA